MVKSGNTSTPNGSGSGPEYTLGSVGSISLQFAEYWWGLPKDNLIPRRADFHPEEISKLLPYMVIHELVAPDFIKIRLSGTNLHETYGQKITGKNYLDFVDPTRRAKASEAIFHVCRHPAGMFVELDSITETGSSLQRETICFPVRDDDGAAKYAYFCSSPLANNTMRDEAHDQLRTMGVLSRRYIDIGAGTPEFHE